MQNMDIREKNIQFVTEDGIIVQLEIQKKSIYFNEILMLWENNIIY